MAQRYILLKNAKLLDLSSGYRYTKKDVLIKNDLIARIEDCIESTADTIEIDSEGFILSPGFIDIHTHVYPKRTKLGVKADTVGVFRGVTTLFDAGSQGPENFNDFFNEVIKKNKTSVYAFLNIAKTGLEKDRYEVSSLDNIDTYMVKEIYNGNKEFIKGIKVRASASTVGDLGMKPIEIAKSTSKELGIPLIIHIGNYPPYIDDVLGILEKGDVVTHTFHGKENGLFSDNKIRTSFIDAKERGVLFDVGHGSSSFNFKVFEQALKEGFYPNFISTDIYIDNINGPVYSLECTINKMIALGLDIGKCILGVTYLPAKHFGLDKMGSIKVGYKADLTLFKINKNKKTYVDSDNNILQCSKNIESYMIIKNGEIIEQRGD